MVDMMDFRKSRSKKPSMRDSLIGGIKRSVLNNEPSTNGPVSISPSAKDELRNALENEIEVIDVATGTSPRINVDTQR